MKKLIKSLTLSFLSVGAVIAISGCGGGGGSTTNEITHNGFTYKTVTSPATGKVWLDRNIGAAEVCTAYNDVACYGDYFQWGRNADGHEDSNSGVTNIQASSVDNVGHSQFIKVTSSAFKGDWAYSIDASGATRAVNWSKTDGTSVCPVGFRVPTRAELEAEFNGLGIHNRDDAFNSILKLPSAGWRNVTTANMKNMGIVGTYWTTTVNSYESVYIGFTDTVIKIQPIRRGYGLSIRCIKN